MSKVILHLAFLLTLTKAQTHKPTTPLLAQSVSANNPFVKNPSADQLPLWAQAHLFGSKIKATNAAGAPMPSLISSYGVGKTGPILMQDYFLLDKLASFNRERTPERVVHAKGPGAFGTLYVTADISKYTKAKVFRLGKTTKMLARISVTSGESGYPDTIRDARGFALKFYTEDGILDFTGNQIDVFNIRDPMSFPDVNKSRKRNPQTHVKDPNMYWDFVQQKPETTHHLLKLFSDIGLPGSLRGINGSAVNIFTCINSQGLAVYCRFSWRNIQQIKPLTPAESVTLAGTETDFYFTDLYNAIGNGDFPKWSIGIQVMTFAQAATISFNPFDNTKNWPFGDFPYIPFGYFVLNRNPTDYFTQIEQAAFSPSNLVPGIEGSPDRMLTARMFAYKDAQRYRLGANFESIEVNRPVSPVNSYERDGSMRLRPEVNGDGGPVYYPNGFNGPTVDPSAKQFAYSIHGIADRVDFSDDDNFSQPREYLANEVGDDERQRIADNIALALKSATEFVRNRTLTNCFYPITQQFGDMVRNSLEAALAKL